MTTTLDAKKSYSIVGFIVITAPTNHDLSTYCLDSCAVKNVIDLIMKYNLDTLMVIKSTIPVGYTENIREKTCD